MSTEREPVARIFTTEGASFYIDSKRGTATAVDQADCKNCRIYGYPSPRLRLQGPTSAPGCPVRRLSRV